MSTTDQIFYFFFSKLFWRRGWRFLRYCVRRLDEERLAGVAGNMAFTAILAMVPTIIILTILPQLDMFRKPLETYFKRGLLPSNVAHTISHHLDTFTANASNVSIFGIIVLLFSTLMMINMMEDAFNQIWSIKESRPLPNRILLYFTITVSGPVVLGISFFLTYRMFMIADNLVDNVHASSGFSFSMLQMTFTTIIFMFLYRVVPYCIVEWKDAFWGGLWVAICLFIAKKAFVFFIVRFASYEKIYGSLATIPIFLIWTYVTCLCILTGAVLASALPDFRENRWQYKPTKGIEFIDAIRIIYILHHVAIPNDTSIKTQYTEIFKHLSIARLESVLFNLTKVRWIKRIQVPFFSFFQWRTGFVKQPMEEWQWVGDINKITLADVYELFVYKVTSTNVLSRKVDTAIDAYLSQTLSGFFAGMTAIELQEFLMPYHS